MTFSHVVEDTVENIGYAFSSGCVAGGAFYFASGCLYNPKGKRLIGALKHVRDRTTLFGGSIAMWSFIFNFSRGSLGYFRQKDDKWNACFGGFMSGFISHARGSFSLGLYQGLQYGTLFYILFSISGRG